MPNSLEVLFAEKFEREYNTAGSYPSLFECSDGARYVVKHSQLGRNFHHLINEFIAAKILKLTKIPSPDFALIEINDEIIPDDYYFERGKPLGLCFGSKYINQLQSVNNIQDIKNALHHYKRKKENIPTLRNFLEICAFDIWLRNDDRTPNNPNLLRSLCGKEFQLIAIDHSCIFASLDYNNLEKEAEEIPPIESTLIDKDLFQDLYNKFGLIVDWMVEEVCKDLSNCLDSQIKDIISSIPQNWRISQVSKNEIYQFIVGRKRKIYNHFKNLLEQTGC